LTQSPAAIDSNDYSYNRNSNTLHAIIIGVGIHYNCY